MTIASCRIDGKRSGTRSARSGLSSVTISRLMTAAVKTSRSRLWMLPTCWVTSCGRDQQHGVQQRVGREQEGRQPQLALDQPVDGEARDGERHRQRGERSPADGRSWDAAATSALAGDPLLEGRELDGGRRRQRAAWTGSCRPSPRGPRPPRGCRRTRTPASTPPACRPTGSASRGRSPCAASSPLPSSLWPSRPPCRRPSCRRRSRRGCRRRRSGRRGAAWRRT